jgi:glycosyltransferase involved in cell wall biosynthesis
LAPDLYFAIPGDLETLTGGYVYDRRLAAELTRCGWSIEVLSWAASFPHPSAADKAAAAASLAALPDGSLVLVDGLAYGVLPELAEAEARRLRLVALIHHPLALEPELSPAAHASLRLCECRALAAARAVIATSETTAETLVEDYDVAPERLAVAKPGTDRAPPARGSGRAASGPHLLSVGTLTPRKGYDLLIEALARIADLSWTCSIAGSLTRSLETTAALRAAIAANRLGQRVRLLGEVADLAPLYDSADLFVLASRHEGYGMVFAEALQRGLPVIGTTAGAIPEVVPPAAGLLVPPNDPRSLAEALRQVVGDAGTRRHLAAGARAAAETLPRWEETGRQVSALLRTVAAARVVLRPLATS